MRAFPCVLRSADRRIASVYGANPDCYCFDETSLSSVPAPIRTIMLFRDLADIALRAAVASATVATLAVLLASYSSF